MKDLKQAYTATSEEMAIKALEELESTWETKYPIVIKYWNNNWSNISTYFNFPPEIRRIIYTTNVLEGFNRQLRKFTKVMTCFPTDDYLRNALYLATEHIMTKWTSPAQNWSGTLVQLRIMLDDRLNQYL